MAGKTQGNDTGAKTGYPATSGAFPASSKGEWNGQEENDDCTPQSKFTNTPAPSTDSPAGRASL